MLAKVPVLVNKEDVESGYPVMVAVRTTYVIDFDEIETPWYPEKVLVNEELCDITVITYRDEELYLVMSEKQFCEHYKRLTNQQIDVIMGSEPMN